MSWPYLAFMLYLMGYYLFMTFHAPKEVIRPRWVPFVFYALWPIYLVFVVVVLTYAAMTLIALAAEGFGKVCLTVIKGIVS